MYVGVCALGCVCVCVCARHGACHPHTISRTEAHRRTRVRRPTPDSLSGELKQLNRVQLTAATLPHHLAGDQLFTPPPPAALAGQVNWKLHRQQPAGQRTVRRPINQQTLCCVCTGLESGVQHTYVGRQSGVCSLLRKEFGRVQTWSPRPGVCWSTLDLEPAGVL